MIRAFSLLPVWAARSAVVASFLLAAAAVPAQEEADPAASQAGAAAADEAAPAEAAPAEGAPAGEPAAAAPAAEATAGGESLETIPVDNAQEKVEGDRLETIEVTGSRLRRTDYETSQPVVSISREDIERSGLTDISQVLRQLTAAGNNGLTMSQGRIAQTMGETNLDLRNLGSTHTLLLVNGRRWVTGLIPTQPSVSDYNTIPTAIIERVEILKDGASAIYGSDAIAGVVNVITRKDYQGLGFDYQFGQYISEKDGENQQLSINWGDAAPGRSMFLNLSYTEQQRALTANREITATSVPGTGVTRWSPTTERGRFVFFPTEDNGTGYQCPNVAGIVLGDDDVAAVPAGPKLCDLVLVPGHAGADPATKFEDYRQRIADEDVYNKYIAGSLQEPNERTALYGQFTQKLTDRITFGFDGLYNRRESTTVGQNFPLAGGSLFINKAYLAGIPIDNPYNPFNQDVGIDPTCGYSEDRTACTGLSTGAGVWQIRLGGDRTNWLFSDTVDTVRLATQLNGDFELLSLPLFWNGGVIYARNKIEEISPLYRFDRMQEALDPDCETTPGCVPLNVFQGQAGLTDAALDYVFYDTWQRNESGQDIGFFDVSFEVPQTADWLAAPLAVALGVEYRKEEYSSTLDPVVQQGLTILNTSENLAGSTTAQEAFLELGIPLLADIPLVHALDLDLAGRYSMYKGYSNVETGKIGLRWQPAEDLLVRATYSTGFRAPNVGELFLAPSQSFDPISDPCASAEPTPPPGEQNATFQNCTTDGAFIGSQGNGTVAQVYDLWMGNPDLKPESSKNLTYGLVYSPHQLPDLNFYLDFYKIEVEDFITIGTAVGQYFLDSCYTQRRADTTTPGAGEFCDKVERNEQGVLQYVETPYFNLSGVNTSGIDFGFDFLVSIGEELGSLKFELNTSYLKQFDELLPPPGVNGETLTSSVGRTDIFEGYPRWKAGSHLLWKRDVWSASWSTRLAYTMTEPCDDLYGQIDPDVSYTQLGQCTDPMYQLDDAGEPVEASENRLKTIVYHNVQFGWDLPVWNTDIRFGVNNVLDQDPPLSKSFIGFFWYNYDPNHYEVPGRFGYLNVSYKF